MAKSSRPKAKAPSAEAPVAAVPSGKIPLSFTITIELEPHEAAKLGVHVDGVKTPEFKLPRFLRSMLVDKIASKAPEAIAGLLGDIFDGGK